MSVLRSDFTAKVSQLVNVKEQSLVKTMSNELQVVFGKIEAQFGDRPEGFAEDVSALPVNLRRSTQSDIKINRYWMEKLMEQTRYQSANDVGKAYLLFTCPRNLAGMSRTEKEKEKWEQVLRNVLRVATMNDTVTFGPNVDRNEDAAMECLLRFNGACVRGKTT